MTLVLHSVDVLFFFHKTPPIFEFFVFFMDQFFYNDENITYYLWIFDNEYQSNNINNTRLEQFFVLMRMLDFFSNDTIYLIYFIES